jgi:hypothetical protein
MVQARPQHHGKSRGIKIRGRHERGKSTDTSGMQPLCNLLQFGPPVMPGALGQKKRDRVEFRRFNAVEPWPGARVEDRELLLTKFQHAFFSLSFHNRIHTPGCAPVEFAITRPEPPRSPPGCSCCSARAQR